MLRRLRPRSAYDLIALFALFAAIGTGGAYAADTIGSSDVIDESLLSQDIKNGEVKSADLADGSVGTSKIINGQVGTGDLAASSVTTGKVLNNTLTGTDIAESTLGPVPSAGDADKLDGKDSSAFVQGSGRVLANRVVAEAQGTEILNIPFTGVLTVDGCDHNNGRIVFDTKGTGNVYVTTERAGAIGFQQPASSWISATVPSAYYHIQLARNSGATTQITQIEVTWKAADCVFAAQAVQTPAL
jgi:hypothetical protein